jgi:hypothetical protein
MPGNRNLINLYLGILLLALGAIFLLGQFLGGAFWSYAWPFFIILTGAVFFISMRVGGERVSGLAIPGSIISMVGLILLLQNTFRQWQTWSYAWTLIVVAVGIGLMIHGSYGGRERARQVGLRLVRLGAILFLAFGIFFELLFFLIGERHASAIFWSVALIAVGLYIIFVRGRGISPSSTNLLAFQSTGASAQSTGASAQNAGASILPTVIPPEGDESSAGSTQSQGTDQPTNTPAQSAGAGLTGAFNRVSNRGVGNLHLVQGEAEDLRIEGSDELKARVRTQVKDGTLEIWFEQDWLDWFSFGITGGWKLDYYLTMRDINGIVLRGAGSLDCPKIETTDLELSQAGAGNIVLGSLSATELKVKHSGAGNLNIKSLEVEDLSVDHSGLGNIDLAGRASRQDVKLSGAGNYSAANLESQDAVVKQSGLGNAHVWAVTTLEASLSGVGNIEYRGSPTLTQKASGMGSIRKVG